jgi:hypothetical protein
MEEGAKIWSIVNSLKLLIGVAILLYVNLLLMLYFNVFYRFSADTFDKAMFVIGIDLLLTAIVIFFVGRHYKRLIKLFRG